MHLRLLLLVMLVPSLAGCAGQGSAAAPQMRAGPGETPDRPGHDGKAATSEIVEPTGVVTLKQALGLALAHSPELKAFSWDIRAAEAGRFQAGLGPNPTLAVQAEEAAREGSRSSFEGAETSVKISQRIEMGHKRGKRKTLASLEQELAEWDYRARRLDVTREVTQAFAAVLGSQERLALSTELVRIAEKAHNAVVQRIEAGRDSPVERTKSAVALATARIEPLKARRALEAARSRLAATWGAEAAGFDAVTGELDEVPAVVSSDRFRPFVRQNPDVARWQVEVRRRRAALELEKARATSDVTVTGGWQHFDETDDSAAVLGLSIPLAVTNRNQGGIRKATYLIAKARDIAKAAEIKTLASLEEAAQRLIGACGEAAALKNDVLPGAASSFEAVGQGYRDGKFDYLRVLDAQRTLFETRSRYIESLITCHRAKADVERLIAQSIDSINNARQDDHKESK